MAKKARYRPNAIPGGGGFGSSMAAMEAYTTTNKRAKRKADARAFGQDLMKGENKKFLAVPGRGSGGGAYLKKTPDGYKTDAQITQTASLHGGTTFGTTIHPYDGTDPESVASGTGTSIFDPVLCELCYRWFCPPGGVVWNPFMGESSPGIVASRLKLKYFSIDVRAEQAHANKLQSDTICKDYPEPQWLVGDSAQAEPTEICGGQVDFVFSCPPYANLEVYSDDPQDLSTMEYPDFLIAYRKIIKKAYDALKPNRFACFVVGEVRDDKGSYIGFVPDTVRAFTDAGFHYYNEGILVTAVGSLPVRVRRQFEVARKLGKTHQNVLVFCKGDARKASATVGPAEFGDMPAELIMQEAVAAPPANRWKVSAAWLSKNHDCTLAGIHARCNGGCCYGNTFWPGKSGERVMPDGRKACVHLGDKGCVLSPADKPVTCLLYPTMVNKNETLILHHRATTKTGTCKGNFGHGPPIIDALKDNYIELFGADQYARIRNDVMSGKDSYVDVSAAVLAQIKNERELEAQNVPPIPRSKVPM